VKKRPFGRFFIESPRDDLISKAAGAPQHPTFLCMPKEKLAKEKAPC
jgi:hypothetical protein